MKLWFLLSVPFMMYLVIFLGPVHAQNYNEQTAEKLVDEAEGKDVASFVTGMMSGKQTGGIIAMIIGIIMMVVSLIGGHVIGEFTKWETCKVSGAYTPIAGWCLVFLIVGIVLFVAGLMLMMLGKEKKSGGDKKNKFEMIGMLLEQLQSQANQNVAPEQQQQTQQ